MCRPVGVACLALALLFSGCGGDDFAPVNGRVTVDGKPVPAGTIMFQPDAGPASVGSISSDGTYELTAAGGRSGALVGKHRIAILATRVGAGRLVEAKSFAEERDRARGNSGKALVPGEVIWLVPEKYSRAESSGLTVDVKRGQNHLNFELPAKD